MEEGDIKEKCKEGEEEEKDGRSCCITLRKQKYNRR